MKTTKLISIFLLLIAIAVLSIGCGGGGGSQVTNPSDKNNNNNDNNDDNNPPATPTTGTLVGTIDTASLPTAVNSSDPELNRAYLRIIDPIDEIGITTPMLLPTNQYDFSIQDVPVGDLYLQVKVKVEAIIYPNQSTDVAVVTTNIPITVTGGSTTTLTSSITLRNVSTDATDNTDEVGEFDQIELRGTKKYSNKLLSWGWDVDYKKGEWRHNPPPAPQNGEQEAKPVPPEDKPNDFWDKNKDGVIDWFEELLKAREQLRREADDKAKAAIDKAKEENGKEPDPLPYTPPDPTKPPIESIVGIKGQLVDATTKVIIGPVSTGAENMFELVANHSYSIVPKLLVIQLKYVDNNTKIIERLPLSSHVFVLMADGAAFEPANYDPYDLEVKASSNTNPANLAKGRLVFGFEPRDKDGYLVSVDPSKPIPAELLALPSVTVKAIIKPDPRASQAVEVLYSQNMDQGAIQHFFFYVKPDYITPLPALSEANVAPAMALVPVYENSNTESIFSYDETRSVLEFTYQSEGGVPEPGFFSAYEFDTAKSMWKYKVSYGPSMLFVTQDYPVGLYRLVYYNNLGDGSLPIFMRRNQNRTLAVDPNRPPFGDMSLQLSMYLHPGNMYAPYKGVVSFVAP